MNEIENKTIVVWFSCGVASAIAAKKTIELYGDKNNVLIVNNPVKEEDPDNLRFLKDVEAFLGFPIILRTNKNYPSASAEDVWRKRRYMSGKDGASCTLQLKKEARYQFETEIKIDYHVLGFTKDEQSRHDRFVKFERDNVLPVLINENITKKECFRLLALAGIRRPAIYEKGFPNANCIGCVKSSSPTYWNLVRRTYPEVFQQRAELSREIGCKLVEVKGKRIFLDELDPNQKGGKIKSWDCSIFCDL